MSPLGAERAAQANLLATFQDGNDHRVGHADATDEQGDRTDAGEQGRERLVGRVLGGQCVGRA